jgi:uncharacterized alpha-E superfamily protein
MERALTRIGFVEQGAVPVALAALRGQLTGVTAQAILDQGLHEYLDRTLALLADLTTALQGDYFEAHLGDEP